MNKESIQSSLLLGLLLFIQISGRHFYVLWEGDYFLADIASWMIWYVVVKKVISNKALDFMCFLMALWGVSSVGFKFITDDQYFIIDAILWVVAFTILILFTRKSIVRLIAGYIGCFTIISMGKELFFDATQSYTIEYYIFIILSLILAIILSRRPVNIEHFQ